MSRRSEIVRNFYRAFANADRQYAEQVLAAEFSFSAPPDPHLDRAGFFERCWPGAGTVTDFDLVRLVEAGDEVVVTYEATGPDGGRGRNTEILTFSGEQLTRAEVYFGWDVSRA